MGSVTQARAHRLYLLSRAQAIPLLRGYPAQELEQGTLIVAAVVLVLVGATCPGLAVVRAVRWQEGYPRNSSCKYWEEEETKIEEENSTAVNMCIMVLIFTISNITFYITFISIVFCTLSSSFTSLSFSALVYLIFEIIIIIMLLIFKINDTITA